MDILDCSIEEKSKKGVGMPLKHPGTDEVLTHQTKGDKAPREMFLTLLGPESPEVKRALAKIANRAKRKKDNHVPSNDEVEQERTSDSKLLAGLTVGGLVFMGGKWIDVTPDNAFEVYYAVQPFRGQALTFLLDAGNFTAK